MQLDGGLRVAVSFKGIPLFGLRCVEALKKKMPQLCYEAGAWSTCGVVQSLNTDCANDSEMFLSPQLPRSVRTALLELERAAMTGRIRDARTEITTRLETLQEHPGLHQTELSDIRDALNNLRVLDAVLYLRKQDWPRPAQRPFHKSAE